ncbi:unnamed protein product [Closterium sp. Yama58-4]|nr:unnamed protein product [Closterium sp. Yama58-4]
MGPPPQLVVQRLPVTVAVVSGPVTFPMQPLSLHLLPPPLRFHPRTLASPSQLVVQRLPVTVAVVGGPVAFLSAGHRGPQPVMFNQGLYGTMGERSRSPAVGWLSIALDTLVRAFPPRHLKQWSVPGQSESATVAEPYWLINLGLPRCSLATWASCDGATILQSLPDDVDLVVAELALSDQGERKGQGPESFLQIGGDAGGFGRSEGSSRSSGGAGEFLLLLPRQQGMQRGRAPAAVLGGGGSLQTPPHMRQGEKGNEGGLDGVKAAAGAAVVMVDFFSFCRSNQACREAEVCGAQWEQAECGDGRGKGAAVVRDPPLSFSDVGPFSFGLPPHHPSYPHMAPEVVSDDNITVLAQYYSLPVLSTRDAFFTLLGQQAPGYKLKDIATTGLSNLPLHVEPDSPTSAIPAAAIPPDTADDSYGTAGGAGSSSVDSVDSIDPVDPHALSGALPTALQVRTKYADVITALFHSALTGLIDRLTEVNADNDTQSLLPFLLRPPPPFFSRWLHSTAASAFLRPALPHACFSFRSGAVAPPVLGLQGFALHGLGSSLGVRPGLVAQNDDSWVEFILNTSIPLTVSPDTSNSQPIQLTTIPTVVEVSYLAHANGSSIFGKLQCVENCKCTGVVVTALSASPVPVKESRLLLVSRSNACVMRVQGSRGFHVLGVTVHSVMQQQQDQTTHAMRQTM